MSRSPTGAPGKRALADSRGMRVRHWMSAAALFMMMLSGSEMHNRIGERLRQNSEA